MISNKIVICATQRSGSTMICEDLTNAGFGRPNEWFNTWEKPEGDWSAELETVRAEGTANGIFAVKIMANQIALINSRLARFAVPSFPEPHAHLRTVMDGALWLWNRRRDVVDQAISRYVAYTRDIYHAIRSQDGFVPGKVVMQGQELPPPVYDFEAIKREFEAVKEDDAMWADFFEEHGIQPVVLWYDDVTDGSAVTAVANALGVERAFSGQRNLTKLPANDELKQRFMEDMGSTSLRLFSPRL